MAELTYQELLAQNAQLRAENTRLQARVAELEKHHAELAAFVRQLRQELEEVRRAGKRQAAPFSKGEPKEHPKPPEPPAHAKRHEREAQVPWPIERHFVKQNSTHMARLTIKLRHSCWKESYAKAKNFSNIQNHTKLERQGLSPAAIC